MEKWGLVFCLVIVAGYYACNRSNGNKVNKLVFEEYDFKYDSIGRLDSSRKKDLIVFLSSGKARMDAMMHDREYGAYRETKIQTLSGKDSTCLMIFKEYSQPNYKYCIKQYYQRNWQKNSWAFYFLKKIQGDFSINGYACDKYELEYHGPDSDPNQLFHLYFTNEIKLRDKTGSYFLFPRFYPECWENNMSMDTLNKFLVRVDCLNDQGQILHTFRLKYLEENLEDDGCFHPPPDYPVFTNDSVAKRMLRRKAFQD